jgi:hypothetical protein
MLEDRSSELKRLENDHYMTLRLRKIELYLEKDRIMKFGPSKNKIL